MTTTANDASNVNTAETVHIVDDDPSVRRSLSRLIRSAGMRSAEFACAEDFLRREARDGGGCIILDVQMPGMCGLDLQEELNAGNTLPIVFISGHGDVPMSVRAMKKGAVDFLAKPFDDAQLLGAVEEALRRDMQSRTRRNRAEEVRGRMASLTCREKEVMRAVVAGLLNKQIASDLGISEETIKIHRGRMMRKMGAGSVAELVRMSSDAD